MPLCLQQPLNINLINLHCPPGWGWRHYVQVVCPSHSCECDTSRMPWQKFFKFDPDVHLESKMNWLEFGGQRSLWEHFVLSTLCTPPLCMKHALWIKLLCCRRKTQAAMRPVLDSSALSSDDDDNLYDSSTITSILTESNLQTSSC